MTTYPSADAGGVPVRDPNRPVFLDPRGRRRILLRLGGAAAAGTGIAGMVVSGLLLSSSPTAVRTAPPQSDAVAGQPFPEGPQAPVAQPPPALAGPAVQSGNALAIPATVAVPAAGGPAPARIPAAALPVAAAQAGRAAPESPPVASQPAARKPPTTAPPVTAPPVVEPPAEPPAAPEPTNAPVLDLVFGVVRPVLDPIPVVGALPILGR